MIIDCHGHYTTEPKDLHRFRKEQTEAVKEQERRCRRAPTEDVDDEIRASIEGAQLKFQRERGTDLTIFSPRASGMGHHIGDFAVSQEWTQICNDLIHRVCTLFPKNFIGVCQLPQTQGEPPTSSIKELERCVKELGFVGCNLNPDPSGGYFNAPPLTDKWWYPFYEKMIELDVPAMIHVSRLLQSGPAHHRLLLPQRRHHGVHAAHAVRPVQGFPEAQVDHPAWRRRGAVPLGPLPRHRARQQATRARPRSWASNIFFDTCVYHQPGIDLLTKVVPVDNILFASEMVGAVKGIDPQDRALFRRHQALRRRHAEPLRRRQAEGVRRQRDEGLSAAQSAN